MIQRDKSKMVYQLWIKQKGEAKVLCEPKLPRKDNRRIYAEDLNGGRVLDMF